MFRSIALLGLLSLISTDVAQSQIPDLDAVLEAIPEACNPQWDAAFNCVIGKILFGCGDILGLADSFGELTLETVTCPDLQCLSCEAYAACPDCESEFTDLIGCIKVELTAEMSARDAMLNMIDVNATDVNATGCDEMMMDMNMTDMDATDAMMDLNMTDCLNVTEEMTEDAGIAIDPELLDCALGDEMTCSPETCA